MALDDIRLERDIGIDEQEPIAVCLKQAIVKRRTLPAPAGREIAGEVNDAEARVFGSDVIENLARSVGRAIVDDVDFKVRIILRQDRAECISRSCRPRPWRGSAPRRAVPDQARETWAA